MARFTKIIIDTNVLTKILKTRLSYEDATAPSDRCTSTLSMLESILTHLHNTLDKSQYVYLLGRQVDELTRWIITNICKHNDDLKEQIEGIIGWRRRKGSLEKKGIRSLRKEDVGNAKDRLKRSLGAREYKWVEEQVDSLKDEVDKLIAYFSLGCGKSGEWVKVVTADTKLHEVLHAMISKLGISTVSVKLVDFEEIPVDLREVLSSLVGDP